MKKVPYYNGGKNVLHIDGKAIRPGDTREVDPRQIPGFAAVAKPAQQDPENPIQALLSGKVPEIVAALPGLSADDYAELKETEHAFGNPRKGLVKAFAEEDLRRADQATTATDTGTDNEPA